MQAACAAGPINASCPATASSDTPPIVPSVTGTNYRCVYNDQTNGDPTPSKCYCQCTCMSPAVVESADQEVQREAAAAGSQDNPDAVGELAGGAPAGLVAGPMTTVATNATASATATVSAVVQQLGPHDGFERRRFAH